MTFSFGEKRSIKDENEFMPVTKKLNRLSIANSEALSSGGSINSDDDSSRQSAMQASGHLMYWNDVYRSYNPSLDLNQNPTYFEANRVLFEAHQMRMFRMHQSHLDKFKHC